MCLTKKNWEEKKCIFHFISNVLLLLLLKKITPQRFTRGFFYFRSLFGCLFFLSLPRKLLLLSNTVRMLLKKSRGIHLPPEARRQLRGKKMYGGRQKRQIGRQFPYKSCLFCLREAIFASFASQMYGKRQYLPPKLPLCKIYWKFIEK